MERSPAARGYRLREQGPFPLATPSSWTAWGRRTRHVVPLPGGGSYLSPLGCSRLSFPPSKGHAPKRHLGLPSVPPRKWQWLNSYVPFRVSVTFAGRQPACLPVKHFVRSALREDKMACSYGPPGCRGNEAVVPASAKAIWHPGCKKGWAVDGEEPADRVRQGRARQVLPISALSTRWFQEGRKRCPPQKCAPG